MIKKGPVQIIKISLKQIRLKENHTTLRKITVNIQG